MFIPFKSLCLVVLKKLSLCFVLLPFVALAHIPAYEGERVRNSNHYVDNGFAQPVRGKCDISAFGATDEAAGSANIYLGGENLPPNFFCAFTSQDDWSFEAPIDIIEASRVPAPDPQSLNLDLEEGYVPCDPSSQNPFQCPRQILNPQTGETIPLPGMCIDLGQPGDPFESDVADGNFHCALLPGSPRPRESSVFFSTLNGKKDVDWAVYKYQAIYGQQPIVGAPQVPACKENLNTFVTFAYAGPLYMKDARTGEKLFMPVSTVGRLPDEVIDNLPEGYGLRVTRPDRFRASKRNPRLGYASGFAQNGWLLAPNSVVECIDDFELCYADQSGDLSKHYKGNDLFFVHETESVDLYLMWWNEKGSAKHLTDASMTTGVVDQFVIGDYINISVSGPFAANGRYVHGKCSDPRINGKADVVIENNQ